MAARGAAARCPVLSPKCSDPLRGAIFQAARKRAGARRLPAAGALQAAPRADSSAGRLPFCVFLLCSLLRALRVQFRFCMREAAAV